ncbi:hypothetical protein FQ330_03130 [Agrococcus sediminis]|uniref:Uncharacterized protein n=1 Tax=Agrococcus sediminis TaxID=2599924 RepID=A0A5M8QMJ6_9MICO|nr:hypothetical protein [Agrococcus sediminis]KAA6436411.1 hypothetical protein FQ330_03130 [Agrococcus sediminis]
MLVVIGFVILYLILTIPGMGVKFLFTVVILGALVAAFTTGVVEGITGMAADLIAPTLDSITNAF